MAQVDFQFYDYPILEEDIQSTDLSESLIKKSFAYGEVQMKQWAFEGILIRHRESHFKDHYVFEKKNKFDLVSLEFNLKGNYQIHHVNQVYHVKSRQHNMVYSPQVHNTFRNLDLSGTSLKVMFRPEVFLRITGESNQLLRQFGEKVMQGRPAVISIVSPVIQPDLGKIISEIIHCPYQGKIRKTYMLSKCLELLVVQAETFSQDSNDMTGTQSTDYSQDPIREAKQYLVQHYSEPPSLSQLARIVGINEYKLKKEFKANFRTTVFGFLSEFRLEKARQALLDSSVSISEIAFDLGYSSPQHFSNAFKKKFGVSPKQARINS